MRGPLGEGSLAPQWITAVPEEKENQLPYGKYGMD